MNVVRSLPFETTVSNTWGWAPEPGSAPAGLLGNDPNVPLDYSPRNDKRTAKGILVSLICTTRRNHFPTPCGTDRNVTISFLELLVAIESWLNCNLNWMLFNIDWNSQTSMLDLLVKIRNFNSLTPLERLPKPWMGFLEHLEDQLWTARVHGKHTAALSIQGGWDTGLTGRRGARKDTTLQAQHSKKTTQRNGAARSHTELIIIQSNNIF